jgi:hypothetical protein
MNSGARFGGPAGSPTRVPFDAPDYGARALVLWPRLDIQRLARIRHDRHRVAALVSRRTTLSYVAILQLLGASSEETDALVRDH